MGALLRLVPPTDQLVIRFVWPPSATEWRCSPLPRIGLHA